ncbi:MAG: AGE family epimerase/isomerase [Lentisphaeria bacterium]|nr:AGE family epimerase/isomerase [Lentisphaeria bacterium]
MWQKQIEKYERELTASVIPFWEKHCVDREFGGYFTSLDRDGSVYDTAKYMWMQWRIVYMFAEIYLAGYRQKEYVDIAEQGFDFLYRHGRDEAGRYYFALNREGVPAMAPYSLFSDCFAAMGAAKLYKITGRPRHADAAREAMRNYLERAQSGNSALQWNKSLSGKTPYLSLGHYMMMANLGLIMNDCLGGHEFDSAMETAVDMVLNKFYSPDFGLVFENMPVAGDKPDLDSSIGRQMNPGHVLEAMWFLLSYLENIPGSQDRIAAIVKIIGSTLEFGWDKEFGGIYYFMDALGKPHLELQHNMKLWWVHNEAILASLYAYDLTRDETFRKWFRKLDDWTWNHFPDPEYGEWFAYCDRRGELTHTLKGGKWKTFFHVPRCLLFAAARMRKIAAR